MTPPSPPKESVSGTPAAPADGLVRLLAEGLEELAQPTELAPPLAVLSELLERWAARMSLTGHRDAETIARRLVLDALALETKLPACEALVDLGSGAGFPGLPLALARPACSVTLVEARERRTHFQRAAIRTLGLENTRALRGRSEELPATPHGVAIAQAMADPSQAAAWLLPWVGPGAWIAIPGGQTPPEVPPLPGVEPRGVREYRVPLDGPKRTLWLAQRV